MTERIPARHCTKCGEYKALTEFPIMRRHSTGRGPICKKCHAQYGTEARKLPEVQDARKADRKVRRTGWYDFIKEQKDKPCVDCGNRYPYYVLQFDHVPVRGEKKFMVNMSAKRSYDSALEEIAKCDLVCSNRHCIRTHARRRVG